MKVNFISFGGWPDGEEVFTNRFKRKMKKWTIDEVHDLWLRACDRGSKRYQAKSKQNDKIIKEVTPNERGEYIVYYYPKYDPGHVHRYKFSYHSDWKSYGVSRDRVEMKTRDEKLTFILSKEKEFELGEEYHRLDNLCSDLQWRVKEVLWRMVEEKLQKKFKDVGSNIPDVFILNIGTKRYFIELDEQHKYGYSRFHMKNECTGDVLSI